MERALKPMISLLVALAISVSLPAGAVLGQELCGDDIYENCHPGDANGDGLKGDTDLVYIVWYIFRGGSPPVPWSICSGDANGDGLTNITDAIYLLQYIFNEGPRPFTCEEWETTACGTEQFPPGNGNGCPNPGDYRPVTW